MYINIYMRIMFGYRRVECVYTPVFELKPMYLRGKTDIIPRQ